MSIRVLVVDDEALVRTGFAMILGHQDDIEVVGEAVDGGEAVEMCRAHQPDIVLMDIRMPRMDGIEATGLITALETARPIRVIVLTTFDDDEYVYASLRAGASGFLLKDVPASDLVEAVRAVAIGHALIAPKVTRRLIERFVAERPVDPAMGRRVETLTDRELDVLKELAKGLTNAEIAENLFVGEATIKTHVSHILLKLNARDRVQAVAVAYETGVVMPGSLEL